MAFDYPVTLDLEGKLCLVAGSGPLAVERLTGLLRARADVVVVSPTPSAGLAAQCAAFNTTLLRRPVLPDDLDGATLAIVTREDPCDVPALHAAARERGVLFAALDDIAHCDFGAVSQVRRGSLTLTISSGGRAPALAKRLRLQLERELPRELTELVEVIAAVRGANRRGDVPFAVWADRWQEGLADLDGLLEDLAHGRRAQVEAQLTRALQDG